MGAKPAALAIKTTKSGVDMLTSNALLAAVEEAHEPGDELKLAEFLTPLNLDPPAEFLVDHWMIKVSFVDLFVGVGVGDPLVCPAFPL